MAARLDGHPEPAAVVARSETPAGAGLAARPSESSAAAPRDTGNDAVVPSRRADDAVEAPDGTVPHGTVGLSAQHDRAGTPASVPSHESPRAPENVPGSSRREQWESFTEDHAKRALPLVEAEARLERDHSGLDAAWRHGYDKFAETDLFGGANLARDDHAASNAQRHWRSDITGAFKQEVKRSGHVSSDAFHRVVQEAGAKAHKYLIVESQVESFAARFKAQVDTYRAVELSDFEADLPKFDHAPSRYVFDESLGTYVRDDSKLYGHPGDTGNGSAPLTNLGGSDSDIFVEYATGPIGPVDHFRDKSHDFNPLEQHFIGKQEQVKRILDDFLHNGDESATLPAGTGVVIDRLVEGLAEDLRRMAVREHRIRVVTEQKLDDVIRWNSKGSDPLPEDIANRVRLDAQRELRADHDLIFDDGYDSEGQGRWDLAANRTVEELPARIAREKFVTSRLAGEGEHVKSLLSELKDDLAVGHPGDHGQERVLGEYLDHVRRSAGDLFDESMGRSRHGADDIEASWIAKRDDLRSSLPGIVSHENDLQNVLHNAARTFHGILRDSDGVGFLDLSDATRSRLGNDFRTERVSVYDRLFSPNGHKTDVWLAHDSAREDSFQTTLERLVAEETATGPLPDRSAGGRPSADPRRPPEPGRSEHLDTPVRDTSAEPPVRPRENATYQQQVTLSAVAGTRQAPGRGEVKTQSDHAPEHLGQAQVPVSAERHAVGFPGDRARASNAGSTAPVAVVGAGRAVPGLIESVRADAESPVIGGGRPGLPVSGGHDDAGGSVVPRVFLDSPPRSVLAGVGSPGVAAPAVHEKGVGVGGSDGGVPGARAVYRHVVDGVDVARMIDGDGGGTQSVPGSADVVSPGPLDDVKGKGRAALQDIEEIEAGASAPRRDAWPAVSELVVALTDARRAHSGALDALKAAEQLQQQGIGASAHADGSGLRQAQDRLDHAEAELARVAEQWFEATGNTSLPEVQATEARFGGLLGGAKFSEWLRDLGKGSQDGNLTELSDGSLVAVVNRHLADMTDASVEAAQVLEVHRELADSRRGFRRMNVEARGRWIALRLAGRVPGALPAGSPQMQQTGGQRPELGTWHEYEVPFEEDSKALLPEATAQIDEIADQAVQIALEKLREGRSLPIIQVVGYGSGSGRLAVRLREDRAVATHEELRGALRARLGRGRGKQAFTAKDFVIKAISGGVGPARAIVRVEDRMAQYPAMASDLAGIRYAEAAAAFEERLGRYLIQRPQATEAVRTVVEVFWETLKVNSPERLHLMGSAPYMGLAGGVGNDLDVLEEVVYHGNLRELSAMLFNTVSHVALEEFIEIPVYADFPEIGPERQWRRQVTPRTRYLLLPHEILPPLSSAERAAGEWHKVGPAQQKRIGWSRARDDMYLPMQAPLHRAGQRSGGLVATGTSGSLVLILETARRLGNRYHERYDLREVMLGLTGHLLQAGHHTLHEILRAAQLWDSVQRKPLGFDYDDGWGRYRRLPPLTEQELRLHAGENGLFPDEIALGIRELQSDETAAATGLELLAAWGVDPRRWAEELDRAGTGALLNEWRPETGELPATRLEAWSQYWFAKRNLELARGQAGEPSDMPRGDSPEEMQQRRQTAGLLQRRISEMEAALRSLRVTGHDPDELTERFSRWIGRERSKAYRSTAAPGVVHGSGGLVASVRSGAVQPAVPVFQPGVSLPVESELTDRVNTRLRQLGRAAVSADRVSEVYEGVVTSPAYRGRDFRARVEETALRIAGLGSTGLPGGKSHEVVKDVASAGTGQARFEFAEGRSVLWGEQLHLVAELVSWALEEGLQDVRRGLRLPSFEITGYGEDSVEGGLTTAGHRAGTVAATVSAEIVRQLPRFADEVKAVELVRGVLVAADSFRFNAAAAEDDATGSQTVVRVVRSPVVAAAAVVEDHHSDLHKHSDMRSVSAMAGPLEYDTLGEERVEADPAE